MTLAKPQELVFYRSFMGSFNFQSSYLGLNSSQSSTKIQIPIEIQCGCQHPVHPESGMSVQLTKVDQGLKELQVAFQPPGIFKSVGDFFKALDWLQAHMEHFSEVVISSQDHQIQLSNQSSNFFLQVTQTKILKNQNNSLFWSPVRYEFKFSNRHAMKDFYENSLEELKQNAPEALSDLHRISFKSPKTQNWITSYPPMKFVTINNLSEVEV